VKLGITTRRLTICPVATMAASTSSAFGFGWHDTDHVAIVHDCSASCTLCCTNTNTDCKSQCHSDRSSDDAPNVAHRSAFRCTDRCANNAIGTVVEGAGATRTLWTADKAARCLERPNVVVDPHQRRVANTVMTSRRWRGVIEEALNLLSEGRGLGYLSVREAKCVRGVIKSARISGHVRPVDALGMARERVSMLFTELHSTASHTVSSRKRARDCDQVGKQSEGLWDKFARAVRGLCPDDSNVVVDMPVDEDTQSRIVATLCLLIVAQCGTPPLRDHGLLSVRSPAAAPVEWPWDSASPTTPTLPTARASTAHASTPIHPSQACVLNVSVNIGRSTRKTTTKAQCLSAVAAAWVSDGWTYNTSKQKLPADRPVAHPRRKPFVTRWQRTLARKTDNLDAPTTSSRKEYNVPSRRRSPKRMHSPSSSSSSSSEPPTPTRTPTHLKTKRLARAERPSLEDY
jgi:hypothetical protein